MRTRIGAAAAHNVLLNSDTGLFGHIVHPAHHLGLANDGAVHHLDAGALAQHGGAVVGRTRQIVRQGDIHGDANSRDRRP